MPGPALRALPVRPCLTRPAHWWESDDPDAHRAIAACRTCPHGPTCTTADGQQPRGIIVAGIAYDDDGRVMTLHSCGRPMHRRGLDLTCTRCAHATAVHHTTIAEMRAQGATYRVIAEHIGLNRDAVRGYWERHLARRQRTGAAA